jgi:membrane-associated protein
VEILALGPSWLDPEQLVRTFGTIGLFVIVFAECGLLIGFFLPGDSLLFAAGLLVATGVIDAPIWAVIALIFVAAALGNLTGYAIGRKAGPAVFNRPNSRFFRPEYVEKTSEFFAKYGGMALVLARFVPIVRTFIPVMAGTSRMPFRKFAFFSVLGGALWSVSMTLLGYYLGRIQFVADNVEYFAIGLVVLSILPAWFELRRRTKPSETPDSEQAADETTEASEPA